MGMLYFGASCGSQNVPKISIVPHNSFNDCNASSRHWSTLPSDRSDLCLVRHRAVCEFDLFCVDNSNDES